MQLPLTSKRLDCILTGDSPDGTPNAVLVELKQWTDAFSADEERCVQVQYGEGVRTVQHPSYQAADYAQYLRDHRSVFYEEPAVALSPCSWLHNFQSDPDSTLVDLTKFGNVLGTALLFGASDGREFGDFLLTRLGKRTRKAGPRPHH